MINYRDEGRINTRSDVHDPRRDLFSQPRHYCTQIKIIKMITYPLNLAAIKREWL